MERREFLRSGTTLALGAIAFGADALRAQPGQFLRKSVSGLAATDAIVKNYSKAVGLMKNLPESDPRNWTQQANIHNNFCPHDNWWFLPWHRAYLYYFEGICRDVLNDPTFALPYWDWTSEPKIPQPFLDKASPLWDGSRTAGGKFVLRNEIVGTDVIQRIVGSGSLVDLFSAATTSDNQREHVAAGLLEGTPHNGVHGTIAGDMGSYLSPLDPIFWLHHCNVDRIWASWADVNNLAPTAKLWKDHSLAVFYDSAKKQQTSPKADDTLDAVKYRAVYDGFERAQAHAHASRPLVQSLKSAMVGFEGKIAELPRGLREFAFDAPTNRSVELGRAQQFPLAVPSDFGPLLQKVAASPDPEAASTAATYLLIENVPQPAEPSTALRVFLNCKDPSLLTPLSDPTYVGTVAFFGGASHSDASHPGATFSLNVTSTLSRVMGAGGYSVGGPIDVALLPVDLTNPKRTTPSEVLRPGGIRLVGLEAM